MKELILMGIIAMIVWFLWKNQPMIPKKCKYKGNCTYPFCECYKEYKNE